MTGWKSFKLKHLSPKTWAPATHCRFPPPLTPPCSSHPHSRFLKIILQHCPTIIYWKQLSSSALAFVLSSIREKDPSRHSPNSLRITAIFFPCWVVRMWVSKVVLPAEEIFSCFSFEPWKGFFYLGKVFFYLGKVFLPWKGLLFIIILTWTKLTSNDSDRNLKRYQSEN